MNRNEHGATDNFDIVGSDSIAKLIEIQWPSGIVQSFRRVKANQMPKAVEPNQ